MNLIFPQVLIPGGEFVILNPPNGSSSYSWVADVKEGTDLLFFMVDSQGNQGCISGIEQVSLSSDTSCLNVNSPSSTTSAPSVTQSSTASTPSVTSSQSTPSTTRINTTSVGIIAGSTVGGVVFLGLIIAISIHYRRKASSNIIKERSISIVNNYNYHGERQGLGKRDVEFFPKIEEFRHGGRHIAKVEYHGERPLDLPKIEEFRPGERPLDLPKIEEFRHGGRPWEHHIVERPWDSRREELLVTLGEHHGLGEHHIFRTA